MIILTRWIILIGLGLFWFWIYTIVANHIHSMEQVNWGLVP